MSAIILRDEIVHYEVLGRGRPVIYLHDWVGSWRYWIPSMQATSLSYRTYALDLWGFGDSAKTPGNYSIEGQVNLLDEFLDVLGIGRIALIGHGLGAVIASIFAQRHPRFVDRLMTISFPHSEELINPRLGTSSPVELADWLFSHTPLTEPFRAEATKTDPKAITLSLTSLPMIELAELPHKLSLPYLLVYGQDDPVVTIPTDELFSELNDYAHCIIFEQSGHFPMLEEPRKFNRLIADFLSLNSGESPQQLQLKDEWKRRIR